MAEKESREDKKIRECLREVYGCSDAQLLEDLERSEKSVSASDFAGAEDRIFQRIMERKAAQEKKTEPEKKTEKMETAGKEEIPGTELVPEEKTIRFGKKKTFLAVALAAAFAGMLGVTAIGEKNYFFRWMETDKRIIFDSDKPIIKSGDLKAAYEEAKDKLNIKIMKMEYIPKGMVFNELHMTENTATFEFLYGDDVFYFIQEKGQKEISFSVNSDRGQVNSSIFNKWIKMDVYINEEILENGEQGYAAFVTIDSAIYRLVGHIEREELEKIAEKINFY